MYEYNNGNSFTYSTSSGTYPRIKRVTVTECEYDENGNCIKETVTETEYEMYSPYQPAPYQPYWVSGTGVSSIQTTNETE